MKSRHLLMAVGLAVSAGLAFFGDRTPSDAPAEPVVRPAPAASTSVGPAASAARAPDRRKRSIMILALRPRAELIGREASLAVPPGLFGSPNFGGVASPPAETESPMVFSGAPPLPFTYLGKKYENGTWEVFLAIGDQTYFAREGSVIAQDYVVNAIRPPNLTLTFLPKKEMQTMTIGGDD